MLLPFPLLAPWSLLLKIALEELAKVFNPALPLMERRSRPGDAGASGELIVTGVPLRRIVSSSKLFLWSKSERTQQERAEPVV